MHKQPREVSSHYGALTVELHLFCSGRFPHNDAKCDLTHCYGEIEFPDIPWKSRGTSICTIYIIIHDNQIARWSLTSIWALTSISHEFRNVSYRIKKYTKFLFLFKRYQFVSNWYWIIIAFISNLLIFIRIMEVSFSTAFHFSRKFSIIIVALH